MSDKHNPVKIDIALPLPMPIVGTLMKLIGAAYPNAEMANSASGLRFAIPADAQPQELPENFTPEPSSEDDVNVTSLGPDGISINTPTELAAICLHVMKTAFEEFPDAKNYLETQCYDKGAGKSYVLTFKRAEGKTPHEMRQLAEKERDEAKSELEKVQKELKHTQENLKKVLKSKPPASSINKAEKVSTKKELKALPQATIIKNAHVVAYKRGGEVWYISNVMLQTTEELAASGIEWTVVERGPEQ